MISCAKSKKISVAYNADSVGLLQNFVNIWSGIGVLLPQISQQTDTIAITAAGAIPYYSHLYTIDMIGLEAPDLSKYEFFEHYSRPGHVMKISMDYLYQVKPQFIIGHPFVTFGRHKNHPYGPPEKLDQTLRDEYTAASIELPQQKGYYWQFWVRNDLLPRLPKQILLYKIDSSSK
jgi:hypothetical protein